MLGAARGAVFPNHARRLREKSCRKAFWIGNGRTGAVKMFDSTGQFIEDLVNAGAGGLLTPNAIVVREKPSENNFTFNAGLNDAWYNPETDGQGFYVTVYADLNLVTLAWFTYETTEPASDTPSMLGYAGHRWLTAFGQISGDSVVMSIDITSGGLFDTATAVQHTNPVGSEGTITLSFADCNSGTVEYDIPSIGRRGTVPIQRVAKDNIALCLALSGD